MKNLIPRSSTILFFIIIIFLIFNFISYKLLLKNLHDNHTKNQELTFYLIQRETSNLLTKLLYKYSQQKDILIQKHQEVLNYLENHSYDVKLNEIYEKINDSHPNKPFNIYITDENLVIKNTTFLPDLGFDLSFAKEQFNNHEGNNLIGISPPVFEMYSLKFLSYTDSYLEKDKRRILQISFTYEDINEDLKKLHNLIDTNQNIKNSNAYIIFNNGYIGDFIFKSLKSYKPSLEEIEERIKKGKELSSVINENEYITTQFKKEDNEYKVSYFSQKSPIFDEVKIIYSVIFNEEIYKNNVLKLNFAMLLISFIGISTIYIIYKIRYEEQLLNYKDKFIEHSVHEIKTPLSILSLNNQLRVKTFGEDKYSKKIEGALKTLENSYEDMTFLHTKEKITYKCEILDLEDVLKNRIKYFEIIATTQNRKLELFVSNKTFVTMSKIELHRLIDNNLSNAIKYSDIGTTLKIILKDNILEFHSLGVPIKDKKEIFKKYTRENESVGGHGLGLKIVNDICEKYNIIIDVTSLNNKTNIFSYKFN